MTIGITNTDQGPRPSRRKKPKYYTAEEQAVRRSLITLLPMTCTTCSRQFNAPLDAVPVNEREDFYRLTSPLPLFGLCTGCMKARGTAERVYLVPREVTCNKCRRSFIAELANTDPRTTVDRCLSCNPPKPQPQPGETFHPLCRIVDRRSGKFVGLGSQRRQGGIERGLDYFGYIEAHNADSGVREEVFSPDFVRRAQAELEQRSVREIQRQWGINYESTRQGRISILRLSLPDLEPPPPPEPRMIKHNRPRKCEHGVWMHRDDRRHNSRHCSACYPNRLAADWKNDLSDGEIKVLYEAGAAIKSIAKRLHLTHKSVRAALGRADVDLRPEDRPTVTRKFIRESAAAKSWRRVAEFGQPEEFGPVPLEPETLVSLEAV